MSDEKHVLTLVLADKFNIQCSVTIVIDRIIKVYYDQETEASWMQNLFHLISNI